MDKMLMSHKIIKAINIACIAHYGQVDKAGKDYIFHPFHLAKQMNTEDEVIVALLHDVVEDGDVTYEELKKDFNSNIIDAIKLLTDQEDVEYMEYIQLIKANELAKKVKLVDLKHNSDITRIERPKKKDLVRVEKYKKAIQLLNQ